MDQLADSLEAAAEALTTMDRHLAAHAVPPGSFGADDIGLPGRIGSRLHHHWHAVLVARSREAADTARHLLDLAADIRTTTTAYSDTDGDVARRIRRGI
ncbi:hypothetical protein [Actinoplanes sp. NPDC051859]|uniref:hypothetical protein n=1 Tax=Actinoplanes sp. NPDC051859 TaxID=3363909 RepID=UPI0037A34D1A